MRIAGDKLLVIRLCWFLLRHKTHISELKKCKKKGGWVLVIVNTHPPPFFGVFYTTDSEQNDLFGTKG